MRVFPHWPVVDSDVSLQVQLTMMELNHRETSAADHVDFVHTGNAAFEDRCHKFQDLCWRRGGEVDIREDGVLRAAVVWHPLTCLNTDIKKDQSISVSPHVSLFITSVVNLRVTENLCTCSAVDLAWAWNTLVFSKSRNRSKSQLWMPKVLTDEPNGWIRLSATKPEHTEWGSWCTTIYETQLSVCLMRWNISVCSFHLGKTPQKPPAGVEPQGLGLSFHFLPAGTAAQHAASENPPGEEQRTKL